MEETTITERKLASVKKITNIEPIVGADLIEYATIDNGWKCVVGKGEFVVGDLGIYFEIDSFLPLVPEFEFLGKSTQKTMVDTKGYVLKTRRFKGMLSQGLMLPYNRLERIFVENAFQSYDGLNFSEGSDLTSYLGVDKYEKPIPSCLRGAVSGNFPHFIRKTDAERCQNIWNDYSKEFSDNNDIIIEQLSKEGDRYVSRIEELSNNRVPNVIKLLEFEATIKLDGTSMTVFCVDPTKFRTKKMDNLVKENKELPKYHFGVCQRNFEITESKENSYWKMANKSMKEKLIQFHIETGRNIAVQGELCGEGIGKNWEKIKGHQFFCYEVWDIDEQRYLTRDERKEIVDFIKVETVPFVENIKVFERFKTIEELLKYAEGCSINNPIREGIVFKSLTLVNGRTVSFKAISNEYLLNGGH